jgi:hypothetical protein
MSEQNLFEKRNEEGAFAEETRRRNLNFFALMRHEIVGLITAQMDIPEEAFEPGEETVFFHFLTSALAVASWLEGATAQVQNALDYDVPPEFQRDALQKLTAAALIRLVLLPSAFGFDEGDENARQRMAFAQAFAGASEVNKLAASFVLMAWSSIRSFLIAMARSWASGEREAPGLDFFSGFLNWLEDLDPDGCMPREAVLDACVQLYQEFVHAERTVEKFEGRIDEDDSPAQIFSAAKAFILPCAFDRHAVLFDGKTFSGDGTTFIAAANLFAKGEDPTKVFFESVLSSDAGPVLGVYLSPFGTSELILKCAAPAKSQGIGVQALSLAIV